VQHLVYDVTLAVIVKDHLKDRACFGSGVHCW